MRASRRAATRGLIGVAVLGLGCGEPWSPRPDLRIDALQILPDAPFNDGLLSCVATITAPEEASLLLRWEVGGRRVAEGPELELDAHTRSPGEEITCRALLTRGHERADRSVSVRVANRPPALEAVRIVPAAARVGETLRCEAEALDPDEDALGVAFRWSTGAEGERYIVEPGDRDLSPLRCWVTVRDPSGAEARGEATAAVLNSPPPAPNLRILPPAPRRGDALRCEIIALSQDPDAEAVSYLFRWFVDEVEASGARTGPTVSVVPGDLVESSQRWRCEVQPTDGDDDGPVASVEVSTPAEAGDVSLSPVLGALRYLPAGTFTMGCVPGRDDLSDDACGTADPPPREVTLTTPLWVMQTEVTQAQWADVYGVNPSFAQTCGGDCPAERISWWGALSYANDVSELEGLEPCYVLTGCDLGPVAGRSCDGVQIASPSGLLKHCRGYRLPTDAEWEHAARFGESLPFPGSDVPDEVARYAGNSGMRVWHACSLSANTLGLCDMSGNVSEWAWDVFTASLSTAPVVDPMGPSGGGFRVRRGGYWGNAGRFVRAQVRVGSNPDQTSSAVGLRLVRSAP